MTFLVSQIVLICNAILLSNSFVAGQVALPAITLSVEATYKTGIFEQSAQEISVFSECTGLIYATSSNKSSIDVLQYNKTTSPTTLTSKKS